MDFLCLFRDTDPIYDPEELPREEGRDLRAQNIVFTNYTFFVYFYFLFVRLPFIPYHYFQTAMILILFLWLYLATIWQMYDEIVYHCQLRVLHIFDIMELSLAGFVIYHTFAMKLLPNIDNRDIPVFGIVAMYTIFLFVISSAVMTVTRMDYDPVGSTTAPQLVLVFLLIIKMGLGFLPARRTNNNHRVVVYFGNLNSAHSNLNLVCVFLGFVLIGLARTYLNGPHVLILSLFLIYNLVVNAFLSYHYTKTLIRSLFLNWICCLLLGTLLLKYISYQGISAAKNGLQWSDMCQPVGTMSTGN